MKLYLTTFFATTITLCSFSKKISNYKVKKPILKKYEPQIEKEYILESWDDGEVAWELDPYYYLKNERQLISSKEEATSNASIVTNREKIWGLLEELRIQGIISGFINVAYYNTAASDSIINDLQSFQIKTNDNLSSAFSKNFNSELDLILTLLTLISYKKYQETRIPEFIQDWGTKNKNNHYIKEYRNLRKISTIITLCFIIIFCKSIKSAT
jgi:hypothetical protein